MSKNNRKSNQKIRKKFGKGGNREFKSDVFSMLLEDRKNALDVYNALNHSSYTDADAVEIVTTDHGISLSIRNDASFLIDRHINYYEHQASFNPNMPLRCLIYYVNDIQNDVKYTKREVEKVTKLDFTFETREKMIRRDAKAEGRNETIEELQPKIDSLTEENQLLNDEITRLRKTLADAGLSAD